MSKAKTYLQQFSTDKLVQLVEHMKKATHSDKSPLRKVVNDIFPEPGIFVLRVNELLWPILEILAERVSENKTKGKIAARLNDQEMDAYNSMKKIHESINKY